MGINEMEFESRERAGKKNRNDDGVERWRQG